MARKTRAQITDEELTQQLIEKGQARYEKAKRTKEMNANAKYRSMNREAQFNDQRMGFFERMQRAQEDAHRNESQAKIQNTVADETARQAQEKAQASTKAKSQAATDASYKGEIVSNIKPERTATPPRQGVTKITNSGKMYTAKPKGKRGAIRAALEVGHRMLNKYVDVDGVVEGIARNKAATAAGAATAGIAATAHHIKERQKEQQSDEDE